MVGCARVVLDMKRAMPYCLMASFRQQDELCLLTRNTEEVYLHLCNILMLLYVVLQLCVDTQAGN
jgi:hypothetical protein